MERRASRERNPENIFTCFEIDIETSLASSIINGRQPGPMARDEITTIDGYKIRLERIDGDQSAEYRVTKTMPENELGIVESRVYSWGGHGGASIAHVKRYADASHGNPYKDVDIGYSFDSSKLAEIGGLIDEFNRYKRHG